MTQSASEKSFDARRMSRDIETGEMKQPNTNFQKEFATAKSNQTPDGNNQPETDLEPNDPMNGPHGAGDPAKFADMAQDVTPE